MSGHGGKRPGAGRKPRGALPGRNVTVRVSPEDEAEIVAGLADGETLSDAMREGALALMRDRVAHCTCAPYDVGSGGAVPDGCAAADCPYTTRRPGKKRR